MALWKFSQRFVFSDRSFRTSRLVTGGSKNIGTLRRDIVKKNIVRLKKNITKVKRDIALRVSGKRNVPILASVRRYSLFYDL